MDDDAPRSADTAAIAARLKQARLAAGFRTQKAFWSAFGLPQATYSAHESSGRGLKRSVARDYCARLGIRLAWLLDGEGPMAVPREAPSAILTRGAVQAGSWIEALEWNAAEWRPVPGAAPDPRFPQAEHFGLEVRGSSMNRLYPDGSVIVCVRFSDIQQSPRSGQRVVVQRRSETGLVEATVKELRVDGRGRSWLWPLSDDPAHQTPLAVDDGEEVEVLALVVGAYRPEVF